MGVFLSWLSFSLMQKLRLLPADDAKKAADFKEALDKRLKDLRDKLAIMLKRSGWRLHIKTEETRIYCDWREAK